ncbi:hypothetical protein [Peteryoungia ipomoeae]|uniref:Uncharacterized protein n=1 Tax=Peteryoungia ipomoeae TaxID=1210932 RepID=A0A4S8P171_9HYPH|nr:hypothetical protein [Peteryoungia ipomoeae]THV21289.1 hypothetical protein FAA97_14780 [Peteryoungia ipomoeae]
MKTIIAASALALMTSTSAFATDYDADIMQFAVGVQEALNDIKDVTKATDVAQDAVNAVNLVSLADAANLDTILQKSAVEQDAENSIESGWKFNVWKWKWEPDYVTIKGVTQNATNVANSVSLGASTPPIGTAGVLDSIKQKAFVDQYATNDIKVAYTVEDVAQTAVNAANLISLEMDAPDLDEIKQFAVGDQDALNTIEFKKWIDGNKVVAGKVVPSTQDATNVINSVSVPSVNLTLAQFSAVDQKARNVADSVGSNSQIWDFEQTAVNAANLVSIDSIDTGLGISQVAFVSQNASNLIDANGTVQAVVQSATNVANSIGDLN